MSLAPFRLGLKRHAGGTQPFFPARVLSVGAVACGDPTERTAVTDQDAAKDAEQVYAPGTLEEALLAFQADPPAVLKDAEVDAKTKDGKPGPKYKFTTIQELTRQMRPRLSELGLLWKTKVGLDDGRPVVFYSCMHLPSGGKEEGVMPLVGGLSTMQSLGAAISFARRYSMITYFGLAPDIDTDGAVAEVAAGKLITKGVAAQLVAEAVKLDLLGRLQLASSHVHGSDVGDCSTAAKATRMMLKLSEGEAERLFSKMAEIGGQKAGESDDA